jgi:hypothetical protein
MIPASSTSNSWWMIPWASGEDFQRKRYTSETLSESAEQLRAAHELEHFRRDVLTAFRDPYAAFKPPSW